MTRVLRKVSSRDGGPALRAVDPSRSRKATSEEARAATAEVDALLRSIMHLNMHPAADHIRSMIPPLSAEAVALLAFRAIALHTSARQRNIATKPRKSSLVEKIRKAGVQNYAEAKSKVPELYAKFHKKQLTDAISKANSKAKRNRKSP